MTKEDDAQPIHLVSLNALVDIADEFIGDLNSFRRLNSFLANETGHLPGFVVSRMRTTIDDFHRICESHIEMIAMVKMMAVNVSAAGAIPSYPVVTKDRVKSRLVTITPQVQIGHYRADFVVDTPSGVQFIIECDGLNFHDAEKDARRDADIEATFGMKTFRISGKEIWNSDNWMPMFRRWCRGQFFDPRRGAWIQEIEEQLSKGSPDE